MISVILLATLMIPFRHPGNAQTLPPHTVFDYYQLLPDSYFEANKEERVKWMLDPDRGAVIDVKNRYIYAPGDGAQSSIIVRLFKRRDGRYLMAVVDSHHEDIEYTQIDFYIYRDNRLVKVTKTVMPISQNEELIYEVPRKARTIKVRNRAGKRIYDLVWSGSRFEPRRPNLRIKH